MTGRQNGSASLKDAMAAATAEAEPNINDLIARGLGTARRTRTRRRVAWAAGSATAAAVVLVGVLGPGGGWLGAKPAPGPENRRMGPADPASVAGVYDNLRALLPAGTKLAPGRFLDVNETVPQHSLGSLGGITVSFDFLYDDGHGVSNLITNIDYDGVDQYRRNIALSTCPEHKLPTRVCEVRKLPDGSVVLWSQSAGNGPLSGTADVLRPDGTHVQIDEIATADMIRSDEASRNDLPLTADQLIAIADAPVWAPVGSEIRDSVPKPLAPSGVSNLPTVPSDAPRAKPAKLAATLKSLIPSALHPTDSVPANLNTPYGDGQVLLDDGHGVARISVRNGTAQNLLFKCGTVSSSDQDQCRDLTLPDGTIVQLTHSRLRPGDGNGYGIGVEQWQAAAVRPTGAITVLTEVNSTDPRRPATRPDAPLSLDQLAPIAGDKAWDQFSGQNPPPYYPNPTPMPSASGS